jgi:hypothetical protein
LRFWIGQPPTECQLDGIFAAGLTFSPGDFVVVAARRDWLGGSDYNVLAYRSLEDNGTTRCANILWNVLVPLFGIALTVECAYLAIAPGFSLTGWQAVGFVAMTIGVAYASVVRLRTIRAAKQMVREWVAP